MFLSVLKQPLLHFLLLGALIFLAYAASDAELESEPADLADTIQVDRQTLLDFMQYQANAFEPALFAARLDEMGEAEVQELVQAYVREEALYREALRLGMDEGDYIVRQRLVQKVEFLLENLAATGIEPDSADLEAFYQARLDDYAIASAYTFTHIFFDIRQGSPEQALARAQDTLAESAEISFEESSLHGDRFPFLQDYVERSRDFIVNNFGADFVGELDLLRPGDPAWQGPLTSRYGFHLVLLRGRTEAYTPALAEIRERVLEDFRYDSLLRAREQAEQRVVAEYSVELAL